MFKKSTAVLSALVIGASSFCLAGCSTGKDSSDSDSNSADSNTSSGYLNYTAPEEGEEIAVITIEDYGTIKLKLFTDLLPEACENFLTHAKDGYYDGLTFHRVIDDFMIQGGDPLGNGTGGETIDSLSGVDMGTSDKLLSLVGSVAYANSGATSTNGSQFYIVTGSQPDELTDELFEQYESYGYSFTDEAIKLYQQYGGSPYLDGSYTVFAQVIDGLDIAYEIASITDKDSNDKPSENVVIESITVEEYDGSDINWYKSDYDSLGSDSDSNN